MKKCILTKYFFCTPFHRHIDIFISASVSYFRCKLAELKTRIDCIINPISGGIKKLSLPDFILSNVDQSYFNIRSFFTQSAQHAKELARESVRSKADIVVAVGGDGTINNVAEAVAGSEVQFGIIPMGSGNGLARHLNIPTHTGRALQLITGKHAVRRLDTGMANSHFFVNVAGAGFDAHVSGKFATAPKRGFMSYAQITPSEFSRYKPRNYKLIIDGQTQNVDAFLLCVANGSQYGNNAYIAPGAQPDDGHFNITVLKPFSLLDMPLIGYHLFANTLHKSRFATCFTGSHIIIERPAAELINIDGEPIACESTIEIRLVPSNLNVIVPA